jgi:hypothetical protein
MALCESRSRRAHTPRPWRRQPLLAPAGTRAPARPATNGTKLPRWLDSWELARPATARTAKPARSPRFLGPAADDGAELGAPPAQNAGSGRELRGSSAGNERDDSTRSATSSSRAVGSVTSRSKSARRPRRARISGRSSTSGSSATQCNCPGHCRRRPEEICQSVRADRKASVSKQS